MGYYDELKWQNGIVAVAKELGFKGEKSKSFLIGKCPHNKNLNNKCLTIWPRTQKFYCSHCQKRGDVVNLVTHYQNVNYKDALFYLSERAEIPYLGHRKLTSNEAKNLEAEYQEKALVENMLTFAAAWYHSQLENYPDIKDHLLSGYKFSKEVIEEFQIGFAPPLGDNSSSQLAEYLNSIPEFKGNIALSGLFNFESPEGPYSDFFKGRIIFPYWKAGKVIYMAGMATQHTQVDQHECYIDNDGNLKRNNQGNPEHIKYKKLQTYAPYDPQKEQISIFIQNDAFMGEDFTKEARGIVIVRNAPDFITAVDHGFMAMSPVADKFLEKDFERLKHLTTGIPVIYLINDNEEDEAEGDENKTAGISLTLGGRNIYPVELKKEEENKRISLNQYLKDHTTVDFRELLNKTGTCLIEDIIEEKLPKHPLKALHILHSFIAPVLAEHDDISLGYHLGLIKSKTGLDSIFVYNKFVQPAKNKKALSELKKKKLNIDPQIQNPIEDLSQDPQLYKKRIDLINQSGVVEERKAIAMYFAALDSRLIFSDDNSILAVKNSGRFGSGKSYTLDKCLKIFPKTAFYFLTSASKKSLFYLGENDLKHRTLIFAEGLQLQSNKGDSDLIYVVRSLLSEGRVKYQVPEMRKGGRHTEEKKLNGPTSFITTTIVEKLENQLEDRLFTIHPDETYQQTKRIVDMEGNKRAGKVEGLDKKTLKIWRIFHDSLRPVKIIIPFAPKISQFVNQRKTPPISLRRAFKRVMSVIETVACFHQHQRNRDEQNRVIADISDYWMALQIKREAFMESIESQSPETKERLRYIEENGPVKMKTLSETWGVSGQAVSSWINKLGDKGVVNWCDENGYDFQNDQEAKTAKFSGKGFLKVVNDYTVGLPTPFDLTGKSEWKKGGEQYENYYLDLHPKDDFDDEVVASVQVGSELTKTDDTSKKDESLEVANVIK